MEAAGGPIFILGNHRSGTTWLHQLLAESGCFNVLTAYDVVASARGGAIPTSPPPDDAFARLGLDNRGFDGVPITPGVPEEYNFVLSNAGTGGRLNAGNLGLFRRMCQQLERSPEPRPLVLKNPWDYSNFVYIAAALPGARFIFIHRHPEVVVQSTLHVARTLLHAKHPYLALLSVEYDRLFSRRLLLTLLRTLATGRFGIGARLAVRVVANANRYYVRNIDRLRADQVLTLRYEDLCADPLTHFARALAFCGVPESDDVRLPVPARVRLTRLTSEVQRQQRLIARSMAEYMRVFDYHPGRLS